MKNIIKKYSFIFDIILSPFIFLGAYLLLTVRRIGIERMDFTKTILLKLGIFPIADHYYEPLFNPSHIDKKSFSKERTLPLNLNIEGQLQIINKFSYFSELDKIPREKAKNLEYYYNNDTFECGDGEYLYSFIRLFKPKKVIEIGCGFSTLMAQKALSQNKLEDNSYKCEHICIEPYENSWLEKLDITVLRQKVEDIDKDVFLQLRENDLLFIDSSHIIRPEGDVLFEYFGILPLLNPGVFIHIHDIYTPRHYPYEWLFDKVRFWNEQYLLEAFLMFNDKFKIVAALNFLKNNYFDKLADKFPVLKDQAHKEPGSFWILKM